ncbi:MAG: hypothetical protein ACREMR_03760 [Gemmatimonadales bacterium]
MSEPAPRLEALERLVDREALLAEVEDRTAAVSVERYGRMAGPPYS